MTDLTMGYVGQHITQIPSSFISRTAEGDVKAGDPVVRGALSASLGDKTCKVVDSTNKKFLGIAMNTASAGQSVNIMIKGAVVVEAAVAVDAGDVPSVTASDATFKKAAASNGNISLSGAVYDTTTSDAGQLAIIRLGNTIYTES